MLPKIAIVGRPNVGKSALFNRICNKRIAIVDEAEGVTRDRLYADSELFGFCFRVIDTGGIDPRSQANFNTEVREQAELAIQEADSIILVVDGHIGMTNLDVELAKRLLKVQKPLTLAVNKIDNKSQENLIYPFYKLGIKKVIAVSAAQNHHIAELLEAALEDLPKNTSVDEGPESIKVALVGRPNVGKSSLINTLLEDNRCIVSPIPGTTRDSIDVSFHLGEDLFTLIDTAGIRRKKSEHEVVDKFAALRTEKAIARSDVCLLMIDAQQGMTSQDKKIAKMIEEKGKGCIILLNKWDLVKGFRMEHCFKGLDEEVPFLKHCPKIFLSALTGRNVEKILPEAKTVYDNSKVRISTPQLNKLIESALQAAHPPMIDGRRLRIYYMTQVKVQPPSFIVFVNYPYLMTDTYKKYIYNQFRKTYPFSGVPLRLYLKGKGLQRNKDDNVPPKALTPWVEERNVAHSEEDFDSNDFDDWDENLEDLDESYFF